MTALDVDYGLVAREVLALAPGGTLHVRGLDHLPSGDPVGSDATFYDDDGLPTFVTMSDSPLAAAARQRRGAVLTIPAGTASGFTELVLGGHLVELSDGRDVTDDGVPPDVVAVALFVHTVVLERDTADSPTVGYRAVPLADWTNATPDPLRPAAQRILTHTNHAHAPALREYVAALRAIASTDVLAADLAELDATGVDLRWMDARGAHRVRIRFDRPAGCPGELAARLREVLTG